MPICPNCHVAYDRSSPQSAKRGGASLCDRCQPTKGVERTAHTRQAAVVTKQVWVFSPTGLLEQRELDASAPSLLIDKTWLPRWYVGPKRERSPFAVVYASAPPDAALLGQIAHEATQRFRTEPWMAQAR